MYLNLNVMYKAVEKFNSIAGNLDTVDMTKLKRQAVLVLEEAKETLEGAEQNNHKEILDGVCDVFVTMAGLMQMLEKLGYNVQGALGAVCDNNLSKFPSFTGLAIENLNTLVQATVNKYTAEDIKVTGVLSAEHGCLIFKNTETGKILKPANYQKVELSAYLPEVLHD